MMLDRIFAVLSILALIGFMGIVTVFVNEPDLWIVVILVLAMASYDFWRSLRPRKGPKSDS